MADGRNGYPDRFVEQIALGLVPGHETFRKFGMNDAVISSNTQEVWPLGTQRTLPTTAAVVAITSDSIQDDAAAVGTGAWTVRVQGLDANYLEISEDVALDGLVQVTTTKSFFRVNRAFCLTAGTGQINAGNITGTIGGNAQFYIEADRGQTTQTQYTVPAGKTLVIAQYRMNVGRMAGATDLHVLGQVKPFGTDTAWRTSSDIYLWDGGSWTNDDGATVLPQKTELRQRIESTTTTQVSSVYSGYLVDDSILETM